MIITLAQVKTYLGIADNSLDTQITAMLPIVDAKVKEITNNNWNMQVKGIIDGTQFVQLRTIGTDPFTDAYPQNSYSIGVDWTLDDLGAHLKTGYEISGDGIPDDSYITDVFRKRVSAGGITYTAPVVKMSETATAAGTIDVTIGFNRAYHRTVAKLVLWMINDQSQSIPTAAVSSKSLGDISVTFAADTDDLDGRYGVPRWSVVGLPKFGRGF